MEDPRDIVRRLDGVVGATAALISMALPSRSKIAPVLRMLDGELIIAGNLRSESTKHSISGAIREAQTILRMFDRVPPHGLLLFVGTDVDGNLHRECFEPHVPLDTSLYLVDKTFHTHVFTG